MKKGKAISLLLLILIPLAVLLMLPIHATTITSIDPTSGPTGTVVRLIGEIDTLGGTYQIWFDIDDDGDPLETGELMAEEKTAADSYSVNDTFTVPSCVGSDAGNDHLVGLKDTTTNAYKTTPFYVKTKRSISAPRKQEGVAVPIKVEVTGGVNDTVYNYTVAVTDPAGSTFKHYNFSFKSDTNGAGTVTKNYVATFLTGAHTNYTGTYNMAANETAPGTITNAATGIFLIGLTNATEYRRFETVNIRTAGWTPGQYVYANITDPAGTVVFSSGNVSLADGTGEWDWEVPWNATMGTYTAEVKNATGNDKTVHSIQTFTVKSARLTVTFKVHPTTPLQRTQTASAKFVIKYPNNTIYDNVTHFSSITVSVYYNTTLVTSISLTKADYSADGNWTVSWKIPRDAVLGANYTFIILKENIVDTVGNKGPDADAKSNPFTVQYAVLTVTVTDQPAANYTRTETAMAKINITYPDSTFFTSADLGSILVRVYKDGTNIENVTLAAGDFDSATNKWTVSWVIPWNASRTDITPNPVYKFTVYDNEAIDAPGNKGPAASVSTSTFDVFRCLLNIQIHPEALNLKSKGRWITVYIELPEGYSAADIDVSTIRLDGVVPPETNTKYGFVKDPEIRDRYSDGVPELMVKFSRDAVIRHIRDTYGATGPKFSTVTLTITGEVAGTSFQDSDTLKVIR